MLGVAGHIDSALDDLILSYCTPDQVNAAVNNVG